MSPPPGGLYLNYPSIDTEGQGHPFRHSLYDCKLFVLGITVAIHLHCPSFSFDSLYKTSDGLLFLLVMFENI